MSRRLLGGLCAGVLACVVLPAAADDSIERVEAWMRSVKTLSADFVQVVRGRGGEITNRASGTLALSRPDRFRWDYQTPNVQVIVADGRKLWLYDADLEQVTVRPLQAGLGSTPAMLLSGAGAVGDSFTAGPVERDGEWTWCRLVPKDRSSDFEGVGLGFDTHGVLVAMQLKDKLGQSTELVFSRVKVNSKLDGGLFVFVPPKGADVIGDASK
ncbi:MAG TPA: outer membrane lipoprotein chaperone LolA [Steroidobacteraceae bacterium]|nr:outer membrane lipoprotein chaperone LolA [Steroidobacteraceae bacterium]HQR49798.1 outer membrane lipoprotein chaperone LolA [Steroidobacteraceae bacterium]